MGLNVILIIIGLVICFGGIYLRRVCSGLLGLICGTLGVATFVIIFAGIYSLLEDSTIIIMVVCGLIFAIVSAIFYKACAVINSFLSSFAFIALFLAFASDMDSAAGIIIIAAIIALIPAGISFKFYDYTYVIATALIGAFIASIGGYGLFAGEDIEGTLSDLIIWGDIEDIAPVLIAIILLGIIGFVVQLRRLKQLVQQKRKTPVNKAANSQQINFGAPAVTKQTNTVDQTAAPSAPSFANPVEPVQPVCSHRYCRNCGSRLADTDAFCSVCGVKTQ